MSDELQEAGSGKARKRQGAKPATQQGVQKVKSTIHISIEASRRLDIHATMMDCDRSALVERLINENLRRYVVSDRRGSSEAGPGEEAA